MQTARRLAFVLLACFLFPLVLHAAPLTFASDQEFLESLKLSAAESLGEPSVETICTVNCFGAGSAMCSPEPCQSFPRNCLLGQRGYVQCGSTYDYCEPCSGSTICSDCDLVCNGGQWYCIDDECNCV